MHVNLPPENRILLLPDPLVTTYTETVEQRGRHPQAQQRSRVLGGLRLGHHDFQAQLLDLFTWKRRKEKNVSAAAALLSSLQCLKSTHLLCDFYR